MPLKAFENKYKGQAAYILGTGPSLRNVEPGQFSDGIVIAVNGAILKVPTADYFFSCDAGLTLWKSWLSLKDLQCDLILATNEGFDCFESRLGGRKVFDGISEERIHYLPRNYRDNVFRDDKLIRGSSSVHPAVHFASIMGCDPIVLYGCDCQYADGKKHYWDFPGQPDEGLIKPEYDKFRRPLSPDNPGGATDDELVFHRGAWKELKELNLEAMKVVVDRSGGALKEMFA